MAYKEEVAARLYEAFEERRAEARMARDQFGQRQLAEGIAALVGGEPPNQSVVSRWMAKENPSLPENPILRAAAQVLGVGELWLLFGTGPKRGEGDAMPPGLQYPPGNALKLDAEIAARATRPKRRAKDAS